MITPMRVSAPTPKSMLWPTPQRPAQAAPVRRESVPAGGDTPGGAGGGITPQLSHLGWPNTPFAGAGAAGADDVDETAATQSTE